MKSVQKAGPCRCRTPPVQAYSLASKDIAYFLNDLRLIVVESKSKMRLLDVKDYHLVNFSGSDVPEYAIVSHRWGDDEPSYQEFMMTRQSFLDRSQDGYGWTKVKRACETALSHGYHWVWLDTICINKESSAELSEAINSMFDWYRQSSVCFIFLRDVQGPERCICSDAERLWHPWGIYCHHDFTSSDWFSRAWTLQELLAPAKAEFYGSDWSFIGSKLSFVDKISDATGIPRLVLHDGEAMFRECIGNRMRWAVDRNATRVEDAAYALLGIMNVNMPLLYGEGHKAMRRLTAEIIHATDDETIFSVSMDYRIVELGSRTSLTGPIDLETNYSLVICDYAPRAHYEITNKGLRLPMLLPLVAMSDLEDERRTFNLLVPLNCARDMGGDEVMGHRLVRPAAMLLCANIDDSVVMGAEDSPWLYPGLFATKISTQLIFGERIKCRTLKHYQGDVADLFDLEGIRNSSDVTKIDFIAGYRGGEEQEVSVYIPLASEPFETKQKS